MQSPKDAIDTASDFGFPVVLKPARSRYIKGGCVFSTSVQIAPSAEKLKALLESLPWVGDIPCIVQRFVPGHGAGIFALYGPSGPIAWFSHRRIREKPPAGGVSVLCESVPVDTLMRSLSERLLSAVNWKGVAMVEFRVSDAGTPYLMEVNGRFWGSLQLAVDCDVDFPWLLYQTAHQVPVTGPSSYLIGHRLRWLLGDLDSLFIRVRRDSSTSRQRFRAVCDFLRSFGDIHCRQEIFRLNDPAPALREFRQWLRAARGGK